MDTDVPMGSITEGVDTASIMKSIESQEQFTVPLSGDKVKTFLQECGLIWNPDEHQYHSLVDGAKWQISDVGDGSTKVELVPAVAGAPGVVSVDAAGAINGIHFGADELEEENARLNGLELDSPEGKSMDLPAT